MGGGGEAGGSDPVILSPEGEESFGKDPPLRSGRQGVQGDGRRGLAPAVPTKAVPRRRADK